MNRTLILILLLSIITLQAGKFEYASVKINSPQDLQYLAEKGIDIDRSSLGKFGKPIDGKVTVYVTQEQFSLIKDSGYITEWKPLKLPSKLNG